MKVEQIIERALAALDDDGWETLIRGAWASALADLIEDEVKGEDIDGK